MQRTSVCIVQSNVAAFAAGGRTDAFADQFVDLLMHRCPELARELAPDRQRLRRSMLDTFGALLRQAANPQALAARLIDLAAANEERGVRRDHYDGGREVLLSLLREYNGVHWNQDLMRAWEDVLDHVLMHLSPPASFDEAMAA